MVSAGREKSRMTLRMLGALVLMFPLLSYGRIVDYHYLEAEAYQSSQRSLFSDEGACYWMGHPSGGRTVCFPLENNTRYVKYDISDLENGDYYIFVRHLAWAAPQTSVQVLVNTSSLGITEFDYPGTYLGWSRRIGPFTKAGTTELTLTPASGNVQWSYLDVILATNDPNFVPDNTDQDYESLKADIYDDVFSFRYLKVQSFTDKTKVSLEITNHAQSPRTITMWAGVVEKGVTKVSAERSLVIMPERKVVTLDLAVTGDKTRQVITKVLNSGSQAVYATVSCSPDPGPAYHGNQLALFNRFRSHSTGFAENQRFGFARVLYRFKRQCRRACPASTGSFGAGPGGDFDQYPGRGKVHRDRDHGLIYKNVSPDQVESDSGTIGGYSSGDHPGTTRSLSTTSRSFREICI